MLLALHNLLLLTPAGAPSAWYIIGDKRYRLTKRELAELLAQFDDEPEIAIDTPKGPQKPKWKLVQSVRKEVQRIKAETVDDDEEEELILMLAYA